MTMLAAIGAWVLAIAFVVALAWLEDMYYATKGRGPVHDGWCTRIVLSLPMLTKRAVGIVVCCLGMCVLFLAVASWETWQYLRGTRADRPETFQ